MSDLQLTSLFYFVDNFCKRFLPSWQRFLINNGNKNRVRTDCLSISEIIVILLWFNMSGMKCFKHFYQNNFVILKTYFPRSPSYERFINVERKAIIPMLAFLRFIIRQAKKTGVYYIDSTMMEVCKNQRIYRHKTFKNIASRGMSSCGWFYGLKLHIICNHLGEIAALNITGGNISDVNMVANLSKNLDGLLFGDKGYLSKELTIKLKEQNLELITKSRKNMKEKNISVTNKFLLRKRGIVETIFGKMKDYCHLVHTKYRSFTGLFINIFSCLLCYSLNPNKPWVKLNRIGMA
jgi:hypothetical protein